MCLLQKHKCLRGTKKKQRIILKQYRKLGEKKYRYYGDVLCFLEFFFFYICAL